MPPKQFCYWNASRKDREIISDCVEAGLIDTLHSYGDSVTDARGINKCISEIDANGLRFPIWSNHAQAPSNFASSRTFSIFGGDDPTSDIYHADRTIENGVRYTVRGQVTAVIGQGTWPNPMRSIGHSLKSIKTALKQSAKIASAPLFRRYRVHAGNRSFTSSKLEDGQATLEVMRANWHPLGIGRGCSGRYIHDLVQSQYLERLSKSQGAAVVYTHLADMLRTSILERIDQSIALSVLKQRLEDYKILNLTSSDLLDYLVISQNLQINSSIFGSGTQVKISTRKVPLDHRQSEASLLRSGLTLTVQSEARPIVTLNGRRPNVSLRYELMSPAKWRIRFPLQRRKLPASLRSSSVFSPGKTIERKWV